MKTKILSFLVILTLFVCNTIPAKAEGDTKLGGIRAGYQYSDIKFNGSLTNSPLSSFYIGAFKNNKILPTLHWMIGAEYFQNGYKKDDDNKRIFHTISVPINLKFKIGAFYALGGLGANFKVGEDFKTAGVDGGSSASFFDLPVFLGAGIRILIVNIEARYHWGLLEVDTGLKNEYLQVGLGVSF